ncbi:MAG: PAS domain S-box protein, partial [Gammaproteobacteria bacterium]|nr:PAS domain S-box protein [Gammaproteobacteria bacterium]
MQNKTEKIDIQDLQRQIELLQEEKSELVSRVRDLSLRDREKSVQIRTLFDNLPYGVVMFDENRNIVQINQSAAKMLGFEKRQLIGRNCTEVMDCYERHLGCPVLDNSETLDQVRTGCFECGKTLLRSAVKNKGADGVVIVESFGDITELERATMAKTLALQTKSNFLSNISHELRTPMHGIIGFAELLSLDTSGLNEHAQSNIKELKQSASRLWKLLEKLFQAASLEENNLQVHAARFDF